MRALEHSSLITLSSAITRAEAGDSDARSAVAAAQSAAVAANVAASMTAAAQRRVSELKEVEEDA